MDEGTTRRDTDIPMHRLEKPADSTHSSKCGLSPREQLERQVKLHSFTQDEALLSCPNSSGTLRSESEMERNPEVPASNQDEALFHFVKPSGVPRGPSNSSVSLTTQRHLESSLRSPVEVEGNECFPPQPKKNLESPS